MDINCTQTKDTRLGYIEKELKDSLFKKIIRRICNKVFYHTIGDGNLVRMSPIRLRIILAAIRMTGKMSLRSSDHELSKKFADITEKVYAAKRA